MTVRTRCAPSPTGYLHIGSVRTALYAWLFARHEGGEFLLRIEDTDRERSTQPAIDAIHEAMDWLGLAADEAPIYQTQRFDRYRERLEALIAVFISGLSLLHKCNYRTHIAIEVNGLHAPNQYRSR